MVLVVGQGWALGDDSQLASAVLAALRRSALRRSALPPWAPDLAACYRDGSSISACAAKFGISDGSARRMLAALNVRMRPPGPRPARPTQTQTPAAQ
jgi:hypothetical protein